MATNYDIQASTLVTIYKAQARPIWEYAAPIYWSNHALDTMQIVQNRFLRLAYPTAKHTPADVLHVIADLLPVKFHCWQLRLKLITKIIAAPRYHPLSQVRSQLQALNTNNSRLVYSKKNPILNIPQDELYQLSHWGLPTIFFNNLHSNISIDLHQNSNSFLPKVTGPFIEFPPTASKYLTQKQQNNNQLSEELQNLTSAQDSGITIQRNHSFKSIPAVFSNLEAGVKIYTQPRNPCGMYPNLIQVFTDGSVEEMTGGSGVVILSMMDYIETGETFNYPITILDCEMLAIRLALQTVGHCVRRGQTRIYIYSDCEVALKLISQEFYPQ